MIYAFLSAEAPVRQAISVIQNRRIDNAVGVSSKSRTIDNLGFAKTGITEITAKLGSS